MKIEYIKQSITCPCYEFVCKMLKFLRKTQIFTHVLYHYIIALPWNEPLHHIQMMSNTISSKFNTYIFVQSYHIDGFIYVLVPFHLTSSQILLYIYDHLIQMHFLH